MRLTPDQIKRGLILLATFVMVRAILANVTDVSRITTGGPESVIFLAAAFLILSVGVVYLGFTRFVGIDLAEWWGFDRKTLPGDIVWGVIGFVMLMIASALILVPMVAYGLLPAEAPVGPAAESTAASFLFSLFFGFAIAGFQEETIFRGFLQGILTERYGPWQANVLQAAAFSIAHIGYYQITAWPLFILAFVYGMVFGWLRMKRHTLVSPWIAHGLFG